MLICCIACFIARVPDALAQAKPARHFVELGVGSIKGEVDAESVGHAPWPALAVGLGLTNSLSLRLEGQWPGGTTSRNPSRTSAPAYDDHWSGQTSTAAVMLAYSMGQRVRLDVMLGVGVLSNKVRREGFWDEIRRGTTTRHIWDERYRQTFGAYVFGVDLAFPLNDRLSLVPEIRAQKTFAYARGRVFTPRVALRWSF